MMISFIKGKKLSKPTWPYMKNEYTVYMAAVCHEEHPPHTPPPPPPSLLPPLKKTRPSVYIGYSG